MKLFKKRAEKDEMKDFFNNIAGKIEQAVKTDMEQIRKVYVRRFWSVNRMRVVMPLNVKDCEPEL